MTGAELRHLLDRPIAFHRCFVQFGGVKAAVMLSQAFYWATRTTDPLGWFYKTRDEWLEETGLSHEEQDAARKQLRKHAFWDEERRGLPARLYYRVDLDELAALLANCGGDKKPGKEAAPVPNCNVDKEPCFTATRDRQTRLLETVKHGDLPYTETTCREYGRESPTRAPAQGEMPGAGEAGTDQLYQSFQADLFRYLGGVESRAQAEELKRALSLHRDAGRPCPLSAFQAACQEAAAYCQREGRKPTVGALITALNKILNPAPGPAAGLPTDLRAERDALLAAIRAQRAANEEARDG